MTNKHPLKQNPVSSAPESAPCAPMQRHLAGLCALATALIGVWILSVSQSGSVGIGGDAVIYLESARNFAAGRGIGLIQPDGSFRLIPYFPPLYPMVLSLFARMGIDLTKAAAVLNSLCFGMLIALLSLSVSRATRRWIIGLGLGLLLAGSPILIPSFSWAMSEALATFLAVAALVALGAYLNRSTMWLFMLSALCAGGAALTRYSMVAVIGAAILLILLLSREPLKRRMLITIGYSAIALTPLTLWMLYDRSQTATLGSRSLLTGSSRLAELGRFTGQLNDIIIGWFLPESWLVTFENAGPFLTLIVAALTLGAFFASLKGVTRGKIAPETRAVVCAMLIAATFFFAYIVLIAIVSLTTYPPITIGQRMLMPSYTAFWVIVSLIVGIVLNRISEPNRVGLLMFAVAAIAFVGFSGLRGVRIARQNAIAGFAFDAPSWRNSETIAELKRIANPDDAIVTNEETALRLYLNRPVWQLREIYAQPDDPRPAAYLDERASVGDPARKAIIEDGALVILFDSFADQLTELYGNEAAKIETDLTDGLTLLFDGDDGKIWRK